MTKSQDKNLIMLRIRRSFKMSRAFSCQKLRHIETTSLTILAIKRGLLSNFIKTLRVPFYGT